MAHVPHTVPRKSLEFPYGVRGVLYLNDNPFSALPQLMLVRSLLVGLWVATGWELAARQMSNEDRVGTLILISLTRRREEIRD